MKINRGDNVYTMQTRKHAAVIAMPSPHREGSSSSVVVEMPSRGKHDETASNVVMLPGRAEDGGAEVTAIKPASKGEPISVVRMSLMALFKLLGWPLPSLDNDPGPAAAAARPGFWERLSVVSHMHLAGAQPKALAAVIPFNAVAGEMKEHSFAQAA